MKKSVNPTLTGVHMRGSPPQRPGFTISRAGWTRTALQSAMAATLVAFIFLFVPWLAKSASPETAGFRSGPELEAKFRVRDAEALLGELVQVDSLSGLAIEYVGARLTKDTYYDTGDRLLYANGHVLRLRLKYDGRAALQAKRPGAWSGAVLTRDEIAQDIEARDAFALGRGAPLARNAVLRALEESLPQLQSANLLPVLNVEDHRHTFFMGPDEERRRFLMTIDVGSFCGWGSDRTVHFAELELELIGEDSPSSREELNSLSQHIGAEFALARSSDSKYRRGMAALEES